MTKGSRLKSSGTCCSFTEIKMGTVSSSYNSDWELKETGKNIITRNFARKFWYDKAIKARGLRNWNRKVTALEFVSHGVQGGKNRAELNHSYFYLKLYMFSGITPLTALPHTLTKNQPLKWILTQTSSSGINSHIGSHINGTDADKFTLWTINTSFSTVCHSSIFMYLSDDFRTVLQFFSDSFTALLLSYVYLRLKYFWLYKFTPIRAFQKYKLIQAHCLDLLSELRTFHYLAI